MYSKLEALYKDYEVQPYISPERDLESWLLDPKPVPKRNMILLEDGLLAGDIILLWRINFGTFTTESWFPKYFEYSYGIDASKHLEILVKKGYTVVETAFDSLDHLNATMKKHILKSKNITGLSKMRASDLNQALQEHFTEKELALTFKIRGYRLTTKGEQALKNHQAIIDRHPQKKF
ncbi:hypothetical protein SORDD14_00083 [Streptococcus oralis]|uniref:Uncharacterized protein n=1 Tax=Streptococcus oralis TaxID=1303 RepID=A0A139P7L5_STROR|nr:hypothetical protein [Streptococcus oralis]KXT84350.1 hypothetical protein SORDD14_00083 [Streptococcus oralis]